MNNTAANIPDGDKERYNVENGPEMGDIDAPQFTRAWAAGIRTKLQVGLKDIKTEAHHLDFWVKLVREKEVYRLLDEENGRYFTSYEQFCCTPYPWGLGYEKTNIERIIIERKTKRNAEIASAVKPVKTIGTPAVTKSETERRASPKTLYDSNAPPLETSKGGPAYLAARLKRDRPDLLQKVVDGEISSFYTAAILAGIEKKRKSFILEPSYLANSLKKHLTQEQLQELIGLLVDHTAGDSPD